MNSVSPVVKGIPEVIMGKGQEQYNPLPAIRSNTTGMVTTRWKASLKERLMILLTGNVYLQVLTFKKPLQPVKMFVTKPKYEDVV